MLRCAPGPAGTLVSDAEDTGTVMWVKGTRGQLPRAAFRGRAARPIIAPPLPVQCGGVWWWREHGGGGDGDQPAAAFDPRDTSLWISYSAVWPARGSVMWQEEYMIWCWLVAPFHYLTTEWKSVSNSPDVMGTSRGSRRGELTYIDCERQCIIRKIPGPAWMGNCAFFTLSWLRKLFLSSELNIAKRVVLVVCNNTSFLEDFKRICLFWFLAAFFLPWIFI